MNSTTRFTHLAEILMTISHSSISQEQIEQLADLATLVIGYEVMAVCLSDPPRNGYWVYAFGESVTSHEPCLLPFEQGLTGEIIQFSQTIHESHLQDQLAKLSPLEAEWFQAGNVIFLGVPLRYGKRTLGALLFFATQEPYTQEDIQVARLLSDGFSSCLNRARQYQSLFDEHQVLLSVLQAMGDGVVVVNQDDYIVLFNPAAETLLGLASGRVLGRPFAEVLEPVWHEWLLAVPPEPTEIHLPNGRMAQIRPLPLEIPTEGIGARGIILHDITLPKQMEAVKSTFVHTIAHDLKNPIAAIMLASELLDKAGGLSETQARIRTRIYNTAQEMHRFIADLSALDNFAQDFRLELTSFDLVAVVQTLLAQAMEEAERRGLEIQASLPQAVEWVGDKNRLQQMMANLLNNALKFTPEGKITVRLSQQEGTQPCGIMFEVQDTGIGISAYDLPYLGNRFYRVDSPETQAIRGLGMGLAIVKAVVKAHNGRLQMTSQLGEGTTFTVFLPCLSYE